jgi:hypothetical protein
MRLKRADSNCQLRLAAPALASDDGVDLPMTPVLAKVRRRRAPRLTYPLDELDDGNALPVSGMA